MTRDEIEALMRDLYSWAHSPQQWLPEQRVILSKSSAALLQLLSEREWRPIESAPKDGTKVDLWCRAPGLSAGPARVPECWFSSGRWWRYDDSSFGGDDCRSKVHNATHWLPPPAPPLSQLEERAPASDEASQLGENSPDTNGTPS